MDKKKQVLSELLCAKRIYLTFFPFFLPFLNTFVGSAKEHKTNGFDAEAGRVGVLSLPFLLLVTSACMSTPSIDWEMPFLDLIR